MKKFGELYARGRIAAPLVLIGVIGLAKGLEVAVLKGAPPPPWTGPLLMGALALLAFAAMRQVVIDLKMRRAVRKVR